MRTGLKDCLHAAFNARPIGMLIPPNWIGLGVFGLLGFLNPGFWLLGGGLEIGYLYSLSTNKRFQNWLDATHQNDSQRQWKLKLQSLISNLEKEDQRRYYELQSRCSKILEQNYSDQQAISLKMPIEGLRRLLWIYLRLLLTRRSIIKALSDSASPNDTHESLESRIAKLDVKIKSQDLSEELRKSFTGQIDILKQRLEKQQEAKEKLAFLEAELTRIQEQAELIREQASFSANPETVSQQIDHVSETLGGTMQWIQEQQQVYGDMEDITAEPPPIAIEPKQKESQ